MSPMLSMPNSAMAIAYEQQLLLSCIGNRSDFGSAWIVAPRILQTTFGLTSFFLNSLIVLSVLMFRILQSKCHYVIMQLSAANGLLAFCTTIEALMALNRSVQILVVVDWFLAAHVAILTSVLLWALSLSIDRYVAIFHPISYRQTRLRQMRFYSAVIWVLSLSVGVLSWFYLRNDSCDKLTSSPWTSFEPRFISGFCGLYLLMSILTVFGYSLTVFCTRRKIYKLNNSHQANERTKRSQIVKNESLMQMILLIIGSFSFCHLIRPIVYFIETRWFDTGKFHQDVSYEYVSLIMLADGIVNCAIYLVKSVEYRQTFLWLMTGDWGKRHLNSISYGSNEPQITSERISGNREVKKVVTNGNSVETLVGESNVHRPSLINSLNEDDLLS